MSVASPESIIHSHGASLTPHGDPLNLPSEPSEGSQCHEEREEARIVHWIPPQRLIPLLDNAHPACACFPRTEQDIARMATSISRFGIQRPVTLLDGQLLDGQTRVRAAIQLQKPIPAIDLDVESLGALEPFDFALHANRAAAHGRRLSDTQVALLAVSFEKKWFANCESEARKRTEAGVKACDETKGTVLQLAAKRFDVTAYRIKQALAIVAANDPDLYEKVFSNELSITAAAEIAPLYPMERKAAITNLLASRYSRRVKAAPRSTNAASASSDDAADPLVLSPGSEFDTLAAIATELECIGTSNVRLKSLVERIPTFAAGCRTLSHALESLQLALNAAKASDIVQVSDVSIDDCSVPIVSPKTGELYESHFGNAVQSGTQ